MLLIMLKSTTQSDITWFLMPTDMSFCHILGIRTPTVIIHSNFSPKDNNFKFRGNSLRLRVNNCKYKAPKLRSKGSRDNKLLA